MRKIAIFVEGQTELIVVREFLLKKFEYTNIDLICRTLFKNSTIHPAEFDVLNANAEYHYQIINVGNDNAVLSRILKREKYMWNAGYVKIIGLRDMYSKKYREESQVIDQVTNHMFINGAKTTIVNKAIDSNKITVCFAIMETEAWFLGLNNIFEELNPALTNVNILNSLGIDLENDNPESTHYHPATTISNIYGLIGRSYKKKKSDIEAICKLATKNKYDELLSSNKCPSFSHFASQILNLD